MLLTKVEQLGNWNPQLLRELKGRLKFQNIVLTVIVSLASQCLLLLNFWSWLPSHESKTSPYCTVEVRALDNGIVSLPKCVSNGLGQIDINWPLWWSNVFQSLSLLVPLILIIGGAGLLIINLVLEERRGTLNFIRLSPQPSQNILLGKLLGVPVLLYLGIALFVPLHLFSALYGLVSFLDVLDIYVL